MTLWEMILGSGLGLSILSGATTIGVHRQKHKNIDDAIEKLNLRADKSEECQEKVKEKIAELENQHEITLVHLEYIREGIDELRGKR